MPKYGALQRIFSLKLEAAGFSETVMITTNFSNHVNQIMKITRNCAETLTW
jgi:hypothetical protein